MNVSRDFSATLARGGPDDAKTPLLKIVLLLSTAISCHCSLTPPHVAQPKTIVASGRLFERGIQWITFCTKSMVWAFTTADALATYLAAHDKPLAASLCPHPSASSVAFQHASRALLAGAVAAALGNLLRQWCYRELGALFTFELTIAPRHRLVTTGPYAVVRHPSYVGVFLTLLGASAVVLARGSWVRACWSGAPPGGATAAQAVVWVLVAFWCAKVAFAVVNVVRRLDLEERELRRKLGEKWEAYARRVRWKLLPLMC